jgi:uncharacterized SAM-binding protein YcdF (DUF218 family)
MRTFLKLLSVVILSIIFLWVFLISNIYINSKSQDRKSVDAIVVLGASQWNGRPSPALKARLDHALELYKANVANYIVLTGGIAKGDTISESRVGKNYLNKRGIANSKIIIEEDGKTTKESLKKVSEIKKRYDFKSILFVSHGYHLYRIKKIAADYDMGNVYSSAVEIKDPERKFKLIFKESLITILYIFIPDYKSGKG